MYKLDDYANIVDGALGPVSLHKDLRWAFRVFFTNPVFNKLFITSVEISFCSSPRVKETIFISPRAFFLPSGTTYFLWVRIWFPFLGWQRDTCYSARRPGCLTGRPFTRSEAGRGRWSSVRAAGSAGSAATARLFPVLTAQPASACLTARWQGVLMCCLAFTCSF